MGAGEDPDRPSVADLVARSGDSRGHGRRRRSTRQAADEPPEQSTPAPRPAARSSRRPARGSGSPKRHRARRWLLGSAAALVILLAAFYVGLLAYVDNGVARADVLRPSGPEILAADQQLDAENYLIVGSADGDGVGSADGDGVGSADGDGVGSGEGDGVGSGGRGGTTPAGDGASSAVHRDTTILVHLPPDGSRAVVVVFPADAYVDVPSCDGPDGEPVEPWSGAFGSVQRMGGAGCLVRTVQAITGLRVNHYVQLDLDGMPAIVDAVGGVPICLATGLRDADSGLDLPAGRTAIDGAQAPAFLALPEQRGAAETERIARQQQFLGSLLDRALALRTVANPLRSAQLVSAATGALTLDPETTLGDLKNLVDALRYSNSASPLLRTAPVGDPAYTPVGSAQAYQLLDEQRGRELYQSIIEDASGPAPSSLRDAGLASPATGGDCR